VLILVQDNQMRPDKQSRSSTGNRVLVLKWHKHVIYPTKTCAYLYKYLSSRNCK
uniref:Uncharacterized protein n=1 Tax=Oryza brachyantha TaxID=4533 RepID=J3N7X1_ORYBR